MCRKKKTKSFVFSYSRGILQRKDRLYGVVIIHLLVSLVGSAASSEVHSCNWLVNKAALLAPMRISAKEKKKTGRDKVTTTNHIGTVNCTYTRPKL